MRLNLENNLKTSMSIYVLKYVINLWCNNVQYFTVFFFYCFVKSLIKNTEITHVPIIQKKTGSKYFKQWCISQYMGILESIYYYYIPTYTVS